MNLRETLNDVTASFAFSLFRIILNRRCQAIELCELRLLTDRQYATRCLLKFGKYIGGFQLELFYIKFM